MMTMNQLVKRLAAIPEPTITRKTLSDARSQYAAFRASQGFAHAYSPLLTAPGANMKLDKAKDVLTYGLSLSPHRLSNAVNLCPWSTKGCRELCLNFSGQGFYPTVQKGRIVKTRFLVDNPEAFLILLVHELLTAQKKAAKLNKKLGMRLNVLSDVPWEEAIPWLFAKFADVSFYDYTKCFDRTPPSNYHLTYSASERTNDEQISELLRSGQNVTIVADRINKQAPTGWNEFPVHNGDLSDYRPTDPTGVVVWLRPKGRAATAKRGGFVRDTSSFTLQEITV
jgi:hypothetical protein